MQSGPQSPIQSVIRVAGVTGLVSRNPVILKMRCGEDVERAKSVLAKAEKNRFASKSLRATVHLEPRFVAVPAEVVP